MTVDRAVLMFAGVVVLASLALGGTVHPYWLGLTAFVGLGLTLAGATDVCLMAALLVRLPWNRTRNAAGTQTWAV